MIDKQGRKKKIGNLIFFSLTMQYLPHTILPPGFLTKILYRAVRSKNSEREGVNLSKCYSSNLGVLVKTEKVQFSKF